MEPQTPYTDPDLNSEQQPPQNLDFLGRNEVQKVGPDSSPNIKTEKVSDFIPLKEAPILPKLDQSESPDKTEGPNLEIKDEDKDKQEVRTPNPTEVESKNDTDKELLGELKEDRDKLRGINEDHNPKRKQRFFKVLVGLFVAITVLSLVGLVIFRSLDKPEKVIERTAFSLPSDITSKSADEQAALTIVDLARKGNSDEIVTKWLGSKDITASREDFNNLIESYKDSADGKKVELVEKKVGKTNLGVAEADEVNAVSIIYRSSYFEHPNNLYTKLNLYEPAATPGVWKLYLFEFKAEESNQQLKADLKN